MEMRIQWLWVTWSKWSPLGESLRRRLALRVRLRSVEPKRDWYERGVEEKGRYLGKRSRVSCRPGVSGWDCLRKERIRFMSRSFSSAPDRMEVADCWGLNGEGAR